MIKTFITALAAFLFLILPNHTIAREKLKFNSDWKFKLGDNIGAHLKNFDDKSWRLLDLPHDWSIEGEYKKEHASGIAGAFLPTGIGWYRKEFTLGRIDSDKIYTIEFDGVYRNSDVWINGHHLGQRPNGYIGFQYDLTPYLESGKNVISVRVDHSKAPSGRWYTGSGIYRNVWFEEKSRVAIAHRGSFVTTPMVSRQEATISLALEIENRRKGHENVTVISQIMDGEKKIASVESVVAVVALQSLKQELIVSNPELWSPSNPKMYEIDTRLFVDGQQVDQYKTPLGIRKIELRAGEGFFLNDEVIKLKGICNHHDGGGAVGAAVPEELLYRRLKQLKKMGCNALRTTHNPFSPEFYTMCDTLGFMVMNEAFDGWFNAKAKFDYGHDFEQWWRRDLASFIKRDRNHPSVVIWSVGNEVPGFTAEQQKLIVDYVKQTDRTRPVTQGRGYSGPHIDIAGFNGHGEFKGVLENYHKKNPEKLIIGTEITHTLQTRGIYRTKTWFRTKDNPAPWEHPKHFEAMKDRVYMIEDLSEEELFDQFPKAYESSYDNSIVRIGVRDDWNRVEALDYYIGCFRWTGFDYLGESFGWPARTANFGIIDLAGFPKDHYYLYQSLWSDIPMVHILPHWTHPGLENKKIPVVAYTNCEEAELFLNGKSLGRKKMTKARQIVWQVEYVPGTLKVVAYNDNIEKASKSYKTAGKGHAIDMKVEQHNDLLHCEITVVDKKGTMVPQANHLIRFEISGGELIGVENGDILDITSNKVATKKVFNGKLQLLVRSYKDADKINIKAVGDNLKNRKIVVTQVR